MTLRGPSARLTGHAVPLGDEQVVLRVMDEHAVDAGALAAALHGPHADSAPVRPLAREEALIAFAFWLGLHDDAFCRLTAHGEAATRGVVPGISLDASAFGHALTLGVCVGGELAVFASDDAQELAIRRFGTNAGAVDRIQAALIAWDAADRPGTDRLRIEAVRRPGAAWLDLQVAWR